MQYHGCRSHIKDRSKVTELEDKFDLLVDSNDAILERVVSKPALSLCLVPVQQSKGRLSTRILVTVLL